MKNNLDWYALLLIAINTIVAVAIIVFLIYGLEPAYTGPIGDTFGGIFSPVIGLVSIYFIYKSFETQREQFTTTLTAQREQFSELLSTQREQLMDQKNVNKATIGSIYLSELKDWISDIHDSIDRLVYGPTLISHTGRSALEEFATNFSRNGQWTNLDSVLFNDLDFLGDVLSITRKIVSIAEFVDFSKSIIDNHAHELLWRRLNNLTSFIIPMIINIYTPLKDYSLDIINDDKRIVTLEEKKIINADLRIFRYYFEFQNCLKILKNLNILKTNYQAGEFEKKVGGSDKLKNADLMIMSKKMSEHYTDMHYHYTLNQQ